MGVDVIFSDVAQPDQARIVALNAQYFLKNEGHFVISIKASCIDSTVAAEAVFATEVDKLKKKNSSQKNKLLWNLMKEIMLLLSVVIGFLKRKKNLNKKKKKKKKKKKS